MAINTYLSKIILNFNGLNAPVKTHRVEDWINSKNFQSAVYKKPPQGKDMDRLKVTGWEKIFHVNGQDRKAEIARFISDKIDFKTKAIRKTKKDTIA